MTAKQIAGRAAPDGSTYVTITDGAGNLESGVDIGAVTQSGTWTVQPGNTANTTAWKVDGSAVTQPVSIVESTTGGYSFLNIPAGQATTVVKASAGTLHTLTLNSAATATNLTTIYDNATGSGTIIAKPNVVAATVPTTLIFDVAFANGLTIITGSANGGDMTVCFK